MPDFATPQSSVAASWYHSDVPFDLQLIRKHSAEDNVRLRGDWSQDSSVGYGLYGRGVAFRFPDLFHISGSHRLLRRSYGIRGYFSLMAHLNSYLPYFLN
jgi:hypothetical protein